MAEARRECASLVELLDLRQGGLAAALEGGFPELRATVWQSEASVQAAVQALTPQMTENKKRVRGRAGRQPAREGRVTASGATGVASPPGWGG